MTSRRLFLWGFAAGTSLLASLREDALARVFAAEPETIFIDDCCHYNEKGNRLLARFILRTILENTRMTGVKGSPSP